MTPEDRASLERIVHAALADVPMVAHDAASGHPLTVTGFGAEEALGAIDALLSTHVTMGARTRAFEAAWAEACGVKQAVMVNSGSSALLVMLAADTPQQRKPAPLNLQTTARELGVGVSSLLMVGDAPPDMLAAQAAGCASALVSWGYGAHAVAATLQPWRLEHPNQLSAGLRAAGRWG